MSLLWDTDQQSEQGGPYANVSVKKTGEDLRVDQRYYPLLSSSSFTQNLFLLLTSGLNAELSLIALLAGHGKPAAVCVLNPLGSLAVEQALVHWLQLVNGQPVGRGTGFIQPEVPCCHPLPVRPPGAQNKVPWEGDQLLRRGSRVLWGPQVPTNR